MTPVPDSVQRRSIRLRGYNYTQTGAYFITVCARDRVPLFGDVVDGVFRPNELGHIIAHCWAAIPDHFQGIELDAFVIMPNHLHGIIVIAAPPVGATHPSPDAAPVPENRRTPRGPGHRSIGAIVGAFKSATTKQANEAGFLGGGSVWQRNYYEHVIRNDQSLDRIRRYIADNPSNWATDPDNHITPVGATHASPNPCPNPSPRATCGRDGPGARLAG